MYLGCRCGADLALYLAQQHPRLQRYVIMMAFRLAMGGSRCNLKGDVDTEWNERTDLGSPPLQESHWLDGGREGPSNIVSSTNCDEDSNIAKLYHGL